MADRTGVKSAVEIFFSYSHKDEGLRDELEKHLSILKRQGIIKAWHDRRIGAGKEWENQIDEHLERAQIILLLVSSDFLASDYCYDIEMERAMQRHEAGEATVIPILLRPVDYKDAPFGKLQGLPTDFKAVTTWTNQDEAFTNIAQGIRKAVADIDSARLIDPAVAKPHIARKMNMPRIWNIPQRRNPNFTGREELLEQLHKSLKSGEHASLTQAIKGLGGVGKTQLALEYVYRQAVDYEIVWWIRAENTATLSAEYAALAGPLDLKEKESPDQSTIVEAVLRALEQKTKWLLVFDNVTEPKDVQPYLPRGSTGHVIITSRYQAWGGVASPLPIEVMEPHEAVDFLFKRTGQSDRKAALKLAEELGYFPLGLEQAGAYIEASSISLAEYFELYTARRLELWAQQPPPLGYEHTVATTWDISLDAVREEAPAAIDLLNLCAFLAPDNIPLDIIRNGCEFLPSPLGDTAKDKLAFNKAIAALLRYSLIKKDKDTISVHRLVQAVVRDRLAEDDRKTWAAAAVEIVNKAIPYQSDDVRTWADCARLLPHAVAATAYTEKYGVSGEATARLLNQCGLYLKGRALFTEAKDNYERVLKIAEAIHGKNHANVATTLSNLGGVLQALGDSAGAKENFKLALEIDIATYGKNHPEVATDLNNLGLVLRALGDLAGAKKNFEQALEIGIATFGENHPKVAIYLNNLGLVLQALGDLAGAKENYERALKIDEAKYGENHPKVAIRLNNLGEVLRALGDLAGAKINYERALEIDIATFGENHPTVAIWLNNLGMGLQDLGDLAGAKKNFERALEIDIAIFGENHSKVALRLNNLGGVSRALGDLAGAKKNYERALKIFMEFLGEDHPSTKTVRENLEIVIEETRKRR